MTTLKDVMRDFAKDVIRDVVIEKNGIDILVDEQEIEDLLDQYIRTISIRLIGGDNV